MLTLPKTVINDVLGGFIELADLARLDSAFCNRSKRIEFVSILSAEWFRFRPTTVINPERVDWINLKTIALEDVEFKFGREDEWKVPVKNMDMMKKIANTFTQLRSFVYTGSENVRVFALRIGDHSVNMDPIWMSIVSNNPKLKTFKVFNVTNEHKFLEFVRANAPHIQHLDLFSGMGFVLHDLKEVLSNPGSFHSVVFRGGDHYSAIGRL